MARIDYDVGDEIVCIYEQQRSSHKLGNVYTCLKIGPATHEKRFVAVCLDCWVRMDEAICVWTNATTSMESCSCQFRKKLDFKKLCEVDETIKIQEEA